MYFIIFKFEEIHNIYKHTLKIFSVEENMLFRHFRVCVIDIGLSHSQDKGVRVTAVNL